MVNSNLSNRSLGNFSEYGLKGDFTSFNLPNFYFIKTSFTPNSLWAKIGIFFILLFSLASWGWWHFTDDHKRLLQRQIDEAEARTKNFNAHTAFMATQSVHAMRALKN